MLKSVPLTFIVGCAVLVYESSSLPFTDIFTNDAYPRINNETTITESNDAYLTDPNCVQTETTFCVKLASYPEDKIKKLLTSDFDNYFQLYPIIPSDRNQNRDDEGNGMCATSPSFLKPESGITADNIPSLIVNIGLNHSQEIRIEKCMESATCANVNIKENYVSYCKQRYTYQRLLSVDDKFEKLVMRLFKVPSGCCCAVRPIKKKPI